MVEALDYDYSDAANGWTNRLSKRTTTARVTAYHQGLVPDSALNDTKTVVIDYDYYPLSSPYRRLPSLEITQDGDPNQERRVETDFDSYGNTTAKRESGAHMAVRETTYAYTSDGYFEASMINALGHQSSKSWDATIGEVLTETDPNGLITSYAYDLNLNALKRVESPGEQPRRTRRQWCGGDLACPSGTLFAVVEVQDGHPVVRRYYDRLGRVRKEETTGFDGVQQISVITDFDARGRKTRESQPSFVPGGAHFTEYSDFDALGRVGRKVVDRSGESVAFPTFETVYTYVGLRTDISIQGLLQASRTYDARELLLETIDTMGGQTRFAYDGLGGVVSIEDAAGSLTTSAYDDLGQRIWVDDPNRGRTDFEYDASGALVRQVDANQNDVETTYDSLGRPLERRLDGTIVASWTYDPAGALGQVASEHVPGNLGLNRSFQYDPLTRVIQISENVSSTSMQTHVGYDTVTGRRKGVRTPSGRFVGSHFTAYGYPLRTFDPLHPDPSHAYVEVVDVDARGNVTDALLGNGLRQTKTFHPSTGQLAQVCVTPAATPCDVATPSGQELQRIDYEYDDPFGNLTMELDVVHNAQESFQYDNLLRVEASSRSWSGSSPVVVNYAYDAVGNILQKDDYADSGVSAPYVYGNVSRSLGNAGPNAVASVTKPGGVVVNFAYDANGNQTGGDNRTVEYTYINKPSKIIRGTTETTFAYGPDDRRYLQQEGSRSKLYSGSYERMFDGVSPSPTHRDYVSEFAVIETLNGASTVRYIHRDRLGSVDTITTESGSVFEEHSYGPFGAPRDGAKHDNGALLSSAVTERGFTDHEHLDGHQLIHMNGRVYDPLLGRFLSVDPIVGAPNGNGLNPYSYVMNNPLMGTDPSGYHPILILAARVAIMMVRSKIIEEIVKEAIKRIVERLPSPKPPPPAVQPEMPGAPNRQPETIRVPTQPQPKTGPNPSQAAKPRRRQKIGPTTKKKRSGGSRTVKKSPGPAPAKIDPKSSPAAAPQQCFVAGTLVALATASVPIEALAVGDRVITFQGNSETLVDESWMVARVSMVHEMQPDRGVYIELLRPRKWFQDLSSLGVGSTLFLSLPEMGVHGLGQIDAIAPVPTRALKKGRGRIVLSMVTSHSDDVYSVSFVGGERLRGTGSHPLYSLDKDDWVRIRDLRVGERLQTEEGAVTIAALEKVRDIHEVYNLEVEGDHEYLVGAAAIRTHNNKVSPGRKIPNSDLKAPPPRRGSAPIGKDGHPVEIHHRGQQPDSPRDEMTRTEHRLGESFRKNHSNTGQQPSKIDRRKAAKERYEYWSEEFDSGRFDDLK